MRRSASQLNEPPLSMHFRGLSLFPLLFSAFGLVAAAPRGGSLDASHVIHERRDYIPQGWTKRSRVPHGQRIPMRIAMKQGGLDSLDEHLMRVSDPDSEHFGQHWSASQIASTFAPSEETVDAITDWLSSSGIEPQRLTQSASKGWLSFEADVIEAERLLNTDFYVYEHENGKATIGTDRYYVPERVQPHLDFITPTLHFVRPIDKRDNLSSAAANAVAAVGRVANAEGSPSMGSLPKERLLPDPFKVISDLRNCSNSTVPICLRTLYGITPLLGPQVSKDALGVLEFTPQSYVQKDLDTFFHDYAPELSGRKPELVSIDGGYVNATATNFTINGESNLDLQYAMTLSQLDTKLYQVGDAVYGASFSDFLDALDGSFCQYDDPDQDVMYPDNSTSPEAYKGAKQCGGVAATKVLSTSYGQDEHELTPRYATRQCQEYAKLGLQGTTFVFSSGDYGVAGNGNKCQDKNRFAPEFPASCPYVLAAGATQVKNNTEIVGNPNPEQACDVVIYSGGGFSDVFKRPTYQDDAVNAYLKNHNPPYTAAQYNTSGSRAIPDVSANGAHYRVNVGGQYKGVYGTSASAPVWAALISRINEDRARIGKGPIGFINPTLYKYRNTAPILKDITAGNNPGCGTKGFEAVEGYDPVTGLGTPNFLALNALFLSLP